MSDYHCHQWHNWKVIAEAVATFHDIPGSSMTATSWSTRLDIFLLGNPQGTEGNIKKVIQILSDIKKRNKLSKSIALIPDTLFINIIILQFYKWICNRVLSAIMNTILQ